MIEAAGHGVEYVQAPVFGAHPNSAGVVLPQATDHVQREAVDIVGAVAMVCECFSIAVIAAQAAIGSHPHHAVAIQQEIVYVVVAEASGVGGMVREVLGDLPRLVHHHHTDARTDPEVTLAVELQRRDVERVFVDKKMLKTARGAVEVVDVAVGEGKPEIPVFVLQDLVDAPIGNAGLARRMGNVRGEVVGGTVVSAHPARRAYPQVAVAVFQHGDGRVVAQGGRVAVLVIKGGERVTIETVEPFDCPKPHEALVVL